mmetsp:Transcript_35329/g.25772  ORF Transcript_35329/g.25772 Transcript_35329/m.25772 type:complete len:156 (+) Transcript_35329:185-652(+)|eukprot:CAMPEP_0116878354 /NCGR_PEP_ID=MMETSP0463-20121206/10100_1 /TAXON_ID=181622 /ORGANISM="Strombidinopsis sp, Strain SopsisLIS2011" /LENGTH=155 /DNA_ID=CAMNT_0004526483 /DNA_START=130 /DNA_END=597 /DNA_ORIENTATION=-
MDGKVSVFSINDLKQSQQNTLKTSLSVDVCQAVIDSEYFTFNKKQYLVSGLDDGTIQVYNMEKGNYTRPVFSVRQQQQMSDIDQEFSQFAESLYEHDNSVVSIEKNHKVNGELLSASRDQTVMIWKFSDDAMGPEPVGNNEQLLIFQSEIMPQDF